MAQTNLPDAQRVTAAAFDDQSFRLILDSIQDGIYVVDRDRRILYWNNGAERLSGYSSDDVVGRYCHDGMLAHVDCQGNCLCQNGCPLAATMNDAKARLAQVFLHHKQGHRVPVQVKATALRDQTGEICGAVEVFTDNTKQQAMNRMLRSLSNLALKDPLTDLPNQNALQGKLRPAVQEAYVYEQSLSLLLIEVERFHELIERYGRDAGDNAIRVTARTLAPMAQPPMTLGRWQIDQFLVLVPGMNGAESHALAAQMRMLIERCFVETSKGIMRLAASSHVVEYHANETPDVFLARAADALTSPKEASGKSN